MTHTLTAQTVTLFQHLLSHASLDEETLLSFARQIAILMDEASKNEWGGLAHATISLDTIFVKEGKLYLPDHRLARLLEQGEKSELRPFLSPEQKQRTSDSLHDQSSDAYAYGVLLYYMLMGHFPEGLFPWPSTRIPILQHNFDSLLRQCLSYHPKERPRSPLAALNAALTPVPQPILRPEKLERPEFDHDPGAIFQKELQIGHYLPKEKGCSDMEPLSTEMALIPGGSFFRGSNYGGRDEAPRHRVELAPYALDIHPVTNEQFIRFLELMEGEKDVNNNDIIRLREARIKRMAGRLQIESGYAKHPVVGVTWYGAVAYAKWLGKRLPTEAEWEVAALGGDEELAYPTGSSIDKASANFFSSDTTAVKSYPPNRFGLFDLAGNVYEWCLDWYDNQYYSFAQVEPGAPRGPAQGIYRVLRGGCWKSSKEDLRSNHRHRNNPGAVNGTYGFRCAADVTQ